MNTERVEVALPSTLTLETAIQMNEVGLRFDGIEHIEDDGTVVFTEEHMAPLQELLHYTCRRMPLREVDHWAEELYAKYHALARTCQ